MAFKPSMMAQEVTCGTFTVPPPPEGTPLDSLIFDRFGNAYHIASLRITAAARATSMGTNGCDLGYFNLMIDPAMPDSHQMTVRQVFCDLATIISSQSDSVCKKPLPNQKVDIQIRWALPQNGAVVGGEATPYYSGPTEFFCEEMSLDRPFIKINGGRVVSLGDLFDGKLVINPNVVVNGIPRPWNTDWTMPNDTNEIDLYTVVLHEALHILGFASRINANDAHSLYDMLISAKNDSTNTSTPVLITENTGGACAENAINCWKLNGFTLDSLAKLVDNNCTGKQPYVTAGGVPVANHAVNPGGSLDANLSHLSNSVACGAQRYVMAPRIGTGPGAERRTITGAERGILCQLGYRLSGCSGCYNIAHPDNTISHPSVKIDAASCCERVFTVCAGDSIEIDEKDLLCNDIGTGNGGQQITRIWRNVAPTAQGLTVKNIGNGLWRILIPTGFNGTAAYMKYTVKGCNCRLHDMEFTLRVNRDCPSCQYETGDCTNLVCSGDFENFTNTQSIETDFGWPVYLNVGYVGTPDIYVYLGNHYLNLFRGEAINLQLKDCIPPQCSLHLQLDVSKGVQFSSQYLNVWGSATRPCDPRVPPAVPIATNCVTPTICSPGNTFNPVCIGPPIPVNSLAIGSDPNLQPVSPVVWHNTSSQDVCFLTLTPSGDGEFYIDNIVATRLCAPTVTIAPPLGLEACMGEVLLMRFAVCAPVVPGQTSTSINLNLTLPTGLELNQGGPNVTVTLGEGECRNVDFEVRVVGPVVAGTVFTAMLQGNALGLCDTVSVGANATVTVGSCPTFNCPCTALNTLNINAATEHRYSILEAQYDYDKNNDGILDATDHNGCIAIAGRLDVDVDLKITRADIKMQPCSEILVQGPANFSPGRQLSLNKNNIYGCNTMWKGITVQSGAALDMVNNPLVADAENAVLAFASPLGSIAATQVTIQSNHFRRNHIGVHIAPPPSGLSIGTVSQMPFVGNTFEAEGLLAACGTRPANYQSAIGYAGVLVRGAAFTVGEADGGGNTFNQLRFGVRGEGVILRVNDGHFSNITGTVSTGIPTAGVGVFGQSGAQEVLTSDFTNCAYAIYSRNANLTMKANVTDQVGICADLVDPINFEIATNWDLKFLDYGVRATGLRNIVAPWNGVPVYFNKYILDLNTFWSQGTHDGSTPHAAVSLSNAGGNTAVPPGSRISRNYAAIFDRINGFYIANQDRWAITDNYVDFVLPAGTDALRHAGFTLSNAHHNYVYGSYVMGNSGPEAKLDAFSTNLSQNNVFCCNGMEGTQRGAFFAGSCVGTEYRNNQMYAHDNPILLNPSGMIGPQGSEGETFSNAFEQGCGIAKHEGGVNMAGSSTFYVTDMTPPNWPDGVDPENFFIPNGIPSNGCVGNSNCPPQEYEDGNYQSMTSDPGTAQGEFENMPDGKTLQWENERELYARMRKHPNQWGQSAVLNTFWAEKEAGSPLKSHHDADRLVEGTDTAPSAWIHALTEAQDSIAHFEQMAQNVLQGLSAASSREDSLELYWQTAALRAQASPYAQTVIHIQTQLDSLLRAKALAALSEVLALPEGTLLQLNRKTAHKVYLEWRASGSDTLTTAQFAEVSPIAHQCPSIGGTAVYLARALYQIKEPMGFNDDELCVPIEERYAVAKSSPQAKALLWPNPSKEQINLWVPNVSPDQIAHVRLMDVSGKTVLALDVLLLEGNATIDIGGLEAGMYFCHIQVDEKPMAILKFVVSK